jgi:hypothetical protein
MENIMSYLSTFKKAVSGIKSVQRGEVSFTNTASTSIDVLIDAVDVSKSELSFLGFRTTSSAFEDSFIRIKLLDSTHIRATRFAGGGTITAVASWELVEWD